MKKFFLSLIMTIALTNSFADAGEMKLTVMLKAYHSKGLTPENNDKSVGTSNDVFGAFISKEVRVFKKDLEIFAGAYKNSYGKIAPTIGAKLFKTSLGKVSISQDFILAGGYSKLETSYKGIQFIPMSSIGYKIDNKTEFQVSSTVIATELLKTVTVTTVSVSVKF